MDTRRLELLEERNERLFKLLGTLDYMIQNEPESTMSVKLVRELLEQVAYGEKGD
jgi:hypothetical protein